MDASRPPEDIHLTIVSLAGQGDGWAVALVLQTEGSTPRKAGAKAIITANGIIHGTIGGGRVEAEVQRRAVEMITAGRPVVLNFDLEGAVLEDCRPVCGGRMRVLIDPTAPRHCEAYAAAVAARQRRERGLLLTAIRGWQEPEVTVRFAAAERETQGFPFPDGDTLRRVLQREQPELCVADSERPEERLEVFVEPWLPNPLLVIVGGGHVGQAVARQASLVGFEVLVIDDRREFTRSELFPDGTRTCCGQIAEEVARVPLSGDTYVVIVTRGHQQDAEALAACVHHGAAYVGLIGSRRKVALLRQDFLASGRATAAEFDRVHAPIGLDIGARTVPEIATSIVAQLIAVRRQGRAPTHTSRRREP